MRSSDDAGDLADRVRCVGLGSSSARQRCVTTTIRPSGIGPARHELILHVPIFRGLGQFRLDISSLGEQARRPLFQQRLRPQPSRPVSGASARAVTTSGVCAAELATTSSIRWCVHKGRQPQRRARLPQEGAFLPIALDEMDHRPRRVSASAQAITRPGKPPPEPRSTQRVRLRRERQKLQRVGDMAGPDSAASRRDEIDSAPASAAAARRSGRAAPLFHVKQGQRQGASAVVGSDAARVAGPRAHSADARCRGAVALAPRHARAAGSAPPA